MQPRNRELGDLLSEMTEALEKSYLPEASIEVIRSKDKLLIHAPAGYYVDYKIYRGDVPRAFYLGREPETIAKAFTKFIKEWQVIA